MDVARKGFQSPGTVFEFTAPTETYIQAYSCELFA